MNLKAALMAVTNIRGLSMLNFKCTVPKEYGAKRSRVKSILLESVPVLISTIVMFVGVSSVSTGWWLLSASFAAMVLLSIKIAQFPFQKSGYTGPDCGNPILETDEQIQQRATRAVHDCLIIGSLWVFVGVVPHYAYVFLANRILSIWPL